MRLGTAFSAWLLLTAAACTGGGSDDAGSDGFTPAPEAGPPLFLQPQMPELDGELIGVPGTAVPGMNATYVATHTGWSAPDGDVIFEAVIRFAQTNDLGCGIFRRAPNGQVNAVLMQNQPLPGTGGGHVIHPVLPLHSEGDTVVMPAQVQNGNIQKGLFAVPKSGGTPVLVLEAGADETLRDAVLTPEGDVLVEVAGPGGSTVVCVQPDGTRHTVCAGCDAGFSTDGNSVVVRQGGAAKQVDLDGTETTLLAPGDPAPGTAGSVVFVREAWLTETGDPVLLVRTDDGDRPEVLLRGQGPFDVLAVEGGDAPGLNLPVAQIQARPVRGQGVVFGLAIEGSPLQTEALFAAGPGETPELVAATGDAETELDAVLAVNEREPIGGGGGFSAYVARISVEGVPVADGVFRRGEDGSVVRVLTTDAEVAGRPGMRIFKLPDNLDGAIDVQAGGRVLARVGIRFDNLPDATLWGLYLSP